jgi:hypothetical protein
MDNNNTIEKLVAVREKFDEFVYMPIDKAIAELNIRQTDKKLEEYTNKILNGDVPEILKDQRNMILFRHIATPNHEVRRFLIAADGLEVLNPVIFEYVADKFNNRNDWKYSLGNIFLSKGLNKKHEQIIECKNIIDFNESNNKPIHSIKTKWGQSLVDFHHEIFTNDFPHLKNNISDLSAWLHGFGEHAKDYYKPFLTLFLKHGILFENFMLCGKELSFTKEIILPALMEIIEETGVRPLIVNLEPTEIEGERFWLSHPQHAKEFIERKLKK